MSGPFCNNITCQLDSEGEVSAIDALARDVGEIESLILSENIIYVFSPDYYSTVNFKDGEVSVEVPFIWEPNNIFIDDKYLGCFTGKKLYLINL